MKLTRMIIDSDICINEDVSCHVNMLEQWIEREKKKIVEAN